MTKIEGSGDCGNSPKNQLAQDIAVGLETGDLPKDLLDDDITWHPPGGKKLEGAETVLDALAKVKPPKLVQVVHAISHGKVGASNGISTDADGKARGFAHVIGFTSTSAKKIADIRSYRTG
ncbi:hypothetical protein FQV27_05880 [Paracoccus aurantiacus]|uniref:Nuclear transport factor 2 family protein n=1 Tax=Paracoccus aurantiacus TaxID=2599412 RepID=A0A5C6S5E5_9RHOB|nr:hypothetical protein [Paracoccus aurantiacus]TXB69649.1 hypothetical protein FQV27_05880 [Paracoccus aurantiacus]